MLAQNSANSSATSGALVWCGAIPRCSGVKQNVSVTSKSASAAIWRSNQASAFGREAVGPGQPRAHVAHAEPLHPGDRLVEPVVLEMEPLAQPEGGREGAEALQCELRRAVLAQQPHVEVPVIGRAFRLLVARRCLPRARQVVEAVPVDARRAAGEQRGGALEAPRLHLFGAEEETPTSLTQTGSPVTARISSSLAGQSRIGHRFQSSGKPCTATTSISSSTPSPPMCAMNCGSIGEIPPSTRAARAARRRRRGRP